MLRPSYLLVSVMAALIIMISLLVSRSTEICLVAFGHKFSRRNLPGDLGIPFYDMGLGGRESCMFCYLSKCSVMPTCGSEMSCVQKYVQIVLLDLEELLNLVVDVI